MAARVNVFEGARRITRVVQVLWVVGAIVLTFADTPYVSATYVIEHFGVPAQKVGSETCTANDGRQWITRTWAGDREASIGLCFKAVPDPKNSEGFLIPYTTRASPDGGVVVWGKAKWAPEVAAYQEKVAAAFQIPASDAAWFDAQWSSRRREQIKAATLWSGGGVAVLWLVTAIVGWIVRGFLGIPAGKDVRPTAVPEPESN